MNKKILASMLCAFLITPAATHATSNKDIVAPTFNYTGVSSFTVEKGNNFTLPTITATDDYTSPADLKIYYTILRNGELVGAIDTNTVGTYAVTYYVEDLAGNIKALTLTVRVTEVFDPSIVNIAEIFTDISEQDWYYADVAQAYNQNLIMGTTETEWGVTQPATRAQVATILHRLDGDTSDIPPITFTDVDENDWYAHSVAWAINAGVYNGFEDGTFKPDDNITREQLAAIIYNYAIYKGYDVATTGNISNFADAEQVSAWSTSAVEWAVGSGIMGGKEDNLLDSKSTATCLGEQRDSGAAERQHSQGAVHRGEVPVSRPSSGPRILRPRDERGVRALRGHTSALH